MLAFVKFLHLLGLILGAGAGIGSLVVVRRMRSEAGAPSPQLAALRPVFGRISLAGIILLWLSGLWLWLVAYGGAALGGAFHAKLGVALLILAIAIVINVAITRARRAGLPPPAWAPRLGMTMPILVLVTVALAVYVFA